MFFVKSSRIKLKNKKSNKYNARKYVKKKTFLYLMYFTLLIKTKKNFVEWKNDAYVLICKPIALLLGLAWCVWSIKYVAIYNYPGYAFQLKSIN